jgi:hypothetical protein
MTAMRLLVVVPSESLDGDDHVMPGRCSADRPRVSEERVDVLVLPLAQADGTAAVALRPQLWE